jgi:hypothetical protein
LEAALAERVDQPMRERDASAERDPDAHAEANDWSGVL